MLVEKEVILWNLMGQNMWGGPFKERLRKHIDTANNYCQSVCSTLRVRRYFGIFGYRWRFLRMPNTKFDGHYTGVQNSVSLKGGHASTAIIREDVRIFICCTVAADTNTQ